MNDPSSKHIVERECSRWNPQSEVTSRTAHSANYPPGYHPGGSSEDNVSSYPATLGHERLRFPRTRNCLPCGAGRKLSHRRDPSPARLSDRSSVDSYRSFTAPVFNCPLLERFYCSIVGPYLWSLTTRLHSSDQN